MKHSYFIIGLVVFMAGIVLVLLAFNSESWILGILGAAVILTGIYFAFVLDERKEKNKET